MASFARPSSKSMLRDRIRIPIPKLICRLLRRPGVACSRCTLMRSSMAIRTGTNRNGGHQDGCCRSRAPFVLCEHWTFSGCERPNPQLQIWREIGDRPVFHRLSRSSDSHRARNRLLGPLRSGSHNCLPARHAAIEFRRTPGPSYSSVS